MSWQVYNKSKGTKYNKIKSSVQAVIMAGNKKIMLTPAAFDAMGKPDRVFMLYDKQNNRIGLQAVDPNNNQAGHAFAVATPSKGSANSENYMRNISCKTFLDRIGVNVMSTRAYNLTADTNIFVIDLNGPSLNL